MWNDWLCGPWSCSTSLCVIVKLFISASNRTSLMSFSAKTLWELDKSRNFKATFLPNTSKRSSFIWGCLKWSFTLSKTSFVNADWSDVFLCGLWRMRGVWCDIDSGVLGEKISTFVFSVSQSGEFVIIVCVSPYRKCNYLKFGSKVFLIIKKIIYIRYTSIICDTF